MTEAGFGAPLVQVVWRDHYTSSEWKQLGDMSELLQPDFEVSIGWLVAEDADRLVLVQTHAMDPKNQQVRDSITLEKSCVVSRVVLDEPEPAEAGRVRGAT